MDDMDRRDGCGVLFWGLSLILSVAVVCAAHPGAKQGQCELISVSLHSGSTGTSGPMEVNLSLDSPLILTCSSSSSGEFVWFKNREKLVSSISSEYKIDAVKSDDGGEYQCAVNVESCGAVKSNPLVINAPPAISEVLGESRVTQGDDVSLTCLATGWPTPLIQWSHGGHVIHTGQQYSISSAQLSDSGKYTCTATNSRGTANSTHSLLVQDHEKRTSHHPKQDGRVWVLRSASDDNVATTSPGKGGGGSLGSNAFIGIILVCVILGIAMIIVVIVVSILCCIAVCKSCRRWMDSRKTGDKARLIPADSDDISEVFDHERIRKNGSVSMVGVPLAAQDTKKTTSKPQKKKKKPKSGIKSSQVQPVDTDSDKVPIITHVDNSLAEDEDLTEAGKGTELVVVENGMKSEEGKEQREGDDDNLAEESVISMIGADDEEVRQVRVKADVSPETAGQSVAQPLSSPSPPQQPPAAKEEHITTVTTVSSAGEGETEHEPVEPATSAVITVESEEPTTKVIYTEAPVPTTVEVEPTEEVTKEPETFPVVAEQTEEPAKVEVPGHESPRPEELPPPPPPTEAPPPEEPPPTPPPRPPVEEEADEEFLAEKAKKLGRSVSFVKQLTRSRPLTMGQISQLVYGQDDTDGASSGNPLFAEYNSVPQNTPTLKQTAAEKEKNRYRNVLPNTHSAVKLKYTGDDGSTYINANYIKGYKMDNAYIATQGPIADTMEDFWRMVWEKNVSVIVMLTGIIERGRHKCAKYWPHPASGNGKLEYGTIVVQNHSETVGRYYNISNITISNLQESAPEREIYHFAYKAWPDFGVPKESDSLLNLVEVVNKYRQQESVTAPTAPIVVHCSAGLGRSGAFMAIDMGIHQFEEEGQVNPLKYMCDMRSDRGGTVQTPEQYVFIHKALTDYMMAREK